jgi:hypothetical protein
LRELARLSPALAVRCARVEETVDDVVERTHPVEEEELLEDAADRARAQ